MGEPKPSPLGAWAVLAFSALCAQPSPRPCIMPKAKYYEMLALELASENFHLAVRC